MELRSVVGALTATIAVGTLASSGSLVLITSYLHRLASQIDDNLQSVRAAEEIQLELLWHARNTNLAVLLANPELAAAAVESQAAIYDWYSMARRYVGSPREEALIDRLEREIESYFAEHASLEAAGLSAAASSYQMKLFAMSLSLPPSRTSATRFDRFLEESSPRRRGGAESASKGVTLSASPPPR